MGQIDHKKLSNYYLYTPSDAFVLERHGIPTTNAAATMVLQYKSSVCTSNNLISFSDQSDYTFVSALMDSLSTKSFDLLKRMLKKKSGLKQD